MYAYAHTPLDEDTIKLTSFSSGDKLFSFTRGFYGLKGLPNFFTKQMSTFFKLLKEHGFALVYIDDILLLSVSKEYMFQLLNNTLDHDMILTNAIHGLTAFHTDLRIDLLIDTTLALDIDHAPIQETIFLQNIRIHTDHLLDQEFLDFLDLVHTPILETKSI